MKAVVFMRYGTPDVLELRDVPRPEPRENEVLVRVHAVSLNDWDVGALHGIPFVNRCIFGLLRPGPDRRILGSDVAGTVEAVGCAVTAFRVGDEVFGDLSGEWGGFAEHVCAPARMLTAKPSSMSFVQAAATPQAGLLALQGLRDKGRIKRGSRVLINGAGGGAGTFAVQIARTYDAEITGVDAAHKLDGLRSMGVAHVIDYAHEDFTASGERYDLVLDAKTNRSIFDCVRALAPDGAYVTIGGSMARLMQALVVGPLISMTGSRRVSIVALKANEGLDELVRLFENGTVVPVIDRTYRLSEVPEAFRRFGAALHEGKIVVDVGAGGS